ncbi:MAG: hypothetical protein KBF60_07525 [Ignavibacteriaceae bacterium]|nr:hypothetical protein [Ignavibacteriaceae bacterium]
MDFRIVTQIPQIGSKIGTRISRIITDSTEDKGDADTRRLDGVTRRGFLNTMFTIKKDIHDDGSGGVSSG